MHDIRWIRDNPEAFDAGLERRGHPACAAEILEIDAERRAVQTEVQALQTRRNEASRQIGQVKRAGGDAAALMEEVAGIKQRMNDLEDEAAKLADVLETRLLELPNLAVAEVPDGADESANVELRRIGERRDFPFTPREHDELGVPLGLDFESAAKLAGARFVVLRGAMARLERALGQFMLDLHTREFGYQETQTPALVRDEALLGTGQLPKFADDQFKVEGGFWLVPTNEVTMTNLVADSILDETVLPLRFTGLASCFRSEAGAAGRDTRGMIRQHQFNKVELVSITHPEHSDAELERMTACAEAVLHRLDLPYRVMLLCAGDMGFAARMTCDIEVWLPGQGRYREISSCSNCGDFQARRMRARFRPEGETKGTRFVHTLNGSGLAVGRTLVAVLENHQNADGSVTVPEALRPYMGGVEVLKPDA